MAHGKSNSRLAALASIAVAAGCSSADYEPPPCRSTTGGVEINTPVTGCPQLTGFAILPSEAVVGGSVELLATAKAPLGATLDFSWTANSGVVANAHSADTTFMCTAPGLVELTITVSNPASTMDLCEDEGLGTVQCDAADGGI
jgi:hypothetical protein